MYPELKAHLDQEQVTLVAVSKTKPQADIQALYDQGQRIFGENRVQEMAEKYEALPKDIAWHMIGHLQSKKVKSIAPFVTMIHSVDSLSLLEKIEREAERCGRCIDVLIQFHIAEEESKYGFDASDLPAIYTALDGLTHVRARGVMGMASFVQDEEQVRAEFTLLRSIFDQMKVQLGAEHFDTVSMGMSGDYKIAIEAGSNMVRLGSLLFGARG